MKFYETSGDQFFLRTFTPQYTSNFTAHYKHFGINSKIHSPWYLNFVISKQNHKITRLSCNKVFMYLINFLQIFFVEIYERPSEFLTIFKSLFFWGSIFSSVMLSLKKVVVKGRSVQKRDNDITRSSIQQVCKQEEEESAQSTTFAYIH